jgi:hypothetical protein
MWIGNGTVVGERKISQVAIRCTSIVGGKLVVVESRDGMEAPYAFMTGVGGFGEAKRIRR